MREHEKKTMKPEEQYKKMRQRESDEETRHETKNIAIDPTRESEGLDDMRKLREREKKRETNQNRT